MLPNHDGYTRSCTQARNCPSYRYLPFFSYVDVSFIKILGAINRHRSGESQAPPSSLTTRRTYVNPSYKPPSSKAYVRPGYQASGTTSTSSSRSSTTVRPPSGPGPSLSQPHDVTLNGIVFESSKRSLVRKDSASILSPAQLSRNRHPPVVPIANPASSGVRPRVQSQFSRNKLEVGPRARIYKPKGPLRNRLKLDNTRKAYQSVQAEPYLTGPSDDSSQITSYPW